jgi:fumarate hydratase class I
MDEFKYQPMYPIGLDDTQYQLLTTDYVGVDTFEGKEVVTIAPEGLEFLAEKAVRTVSFMTRPSHLHLLSKIIEDPESSENDRFVAFAMMNNAFISSEGEFPLSQDTGTAIIIGKKGQKVWTDFSDETALSKGIFNAYRKYNLRYSINAPLTMYEEKNTGCNLPAQIDIQCTQGSEYSLIFLAKGSEAANKTFLFQETKAILNHDDLISFMTNQMKALGTGASPPFHLVFVIGGTSAEANLRTVRLATSGYLDSLPIKGNIFGHAFRDIELEAEMFDISCKLGIGAQFGGKYYCHDVKVLRLPRHGGSCPIGLGVGSGADRRIKANINRNGIFLEKVETDFEQYLPKEKLEYNVDAHINLNRPIDKIRAELSQYPISTKLQLNGKMVVMRDIAHARIKERIDKGEDLPWYVKEHVVYYAGPAKTPKGRVSGSFGPTTGGRMDPYVPIFQALGGSLVTVAKGNRSGKFAESCKQHGGFYLCCLGGMAAVIGKECITQVEVLEYPELGMEAILMITVKNFHAFLMVDDKGNDYFKHVLNMPYSHSVKPFIQ